VNGADRHVEERCDEGEGERAGNPDRRRRNFKGLKTQGLHQKLKAEPPKESRADLKWVPESTRKKKKEGENIPGGRPNHWTNRVERDWAAKKKKKGRVAMRKGTLRLHNANAQPISSLKKHVMNPNSVRD